MSVLTILCFVLCFIIILFQFFELRHQHKIIRMYEDMVDTAIKDLTAVHDVGQFGLENNMHVNAEGIIKSNAYVLNSLRKDRANAKTS